MANLYDFPNMSNGLDQFLVQLSTEIPQLPIMMLIAAYLIVFLGGGMMQFRRSVYFDAPMWSTLGFLTCDLLVLVLSFQAGIINPLVMGVVVGGTFFSGLWLFLTRGRFEV